MARGAFAASRLVARMRKVKGSKLKPKIISALTEVPWHEVPERNSSTSRSTLKSSRRRTGSMSCRTCRGVRIKARGISNAERGRSAGSVALCRQPRRSASVPAVRMAGLHRAAHQSPGPARARRHSVGVHQCRARHQAEGRRRLDGAFNPPITGVAGSIISRLLPALSLLGRLPIDDLNKSLAKLNEFTTVKLGGSDGRGTGIVSAIIAARAPSERVDAHFGSGAGCVRSRLVRA